MLRKPKAVTKSRNSSQTVKDLRTYASYRKFLEDSFLLAKTRSKGVTLSSYAQAFGLAASTFKMILTGARNLSVESIHEVARALRMTPDEHEYFETLVSLDQSADERSRAFYRRRLKRMHVQTGAKVLRVSDRRLIGSSAGTALLVYLIDGVKIKNARWEALDLSDIGAKFGWSAEQTRAQLQVFRDTGLLEVDRADRVHIVFTKVLRQFSELEYLTTELRETLVHMQKGFADPRNYFRTFTLSLAEADLPALRADLTALVESYIAKPLPFDGAKVVEKIFIGAFPYLSF